MKQNPNYALCKIEDTYYLLPFGQGIADHERGIQINETGAFLWNALAKPQSKEKLFEKCFIHYEASEEEIPGLTQDLSDFLFLLTSLGIIIEDWKELPSENDFSTKLQIGPLLLKLTALEDVFPEEFRSFQTTSTAPADLTISLRSGVLPILENGTQLIHNRELHVWEHTDCYHLLFPAATELTEAYLSKAGDYACIYHFPKHTATLTEELLHAIRLIYLYTAQMHGCYALHSASILYREKAWLFSGHSGMGKSTHTNLWNQLFKTPVLNGDLNLLAFCEDEPVIYGIPWCGTSKRFVAKTYPLGGIVLLARDEQDACVELSPDQKALLTAQRLISPSWSKDMLHNHIQFTQRLSKQIHICQLKCTKNDTAAYTMRTWIDAKFTL